jgi:hypothetical protein
MAMEYPCIVYEMTDAQTEFAGNMPYTYTKRYQITVIDRKPDSTIPDTVAWLKSAIFDRHFVVNNLHHSIFMLYF